MADMKILSETPINMAQLKKELEGIKKKDSELNFRAARTEEHLQQVVNVEKEGELFKKLMDLNIPRLREHHIHKIIDVMPATAEDLKIVVQGYTITLSNESVKKITEVLAEFSENK